MNETATAAAPAPAPTKVPFSSKSVDEDAGVAIITFGDGRSLSLALEDLTPRMVNRLALHGAHQKGGDSYAGAKGDYNLAFDSCKDVFDALRADRWTTGRESTGAVIRLDELAEAVARLKHVPKEEALQKLQSADEEKVKTIKSLPEVKAVILDIRAEKARAALQESLAQGKTPTTFDL